MHQIQVINIQSSCFHKLTLTELKYMLIISEEKLAKDECYSAVGMSQIVECFCS